MGLELPRQQVERTRQLGDRGDPGHGGAAFEGVKGALQIVTDRLRQILIGRGQEAVETGQMPLGLVAKNFQQLRIDGLVDLRLLGGVVHGQRVQSQCQLFDILACLRLALRKSLQQPGNQV
ncbi:hypothetical protein D3C77_212570 [compost metagenome]